MTAGPSLGPASAYPTFRTPASICFSGPKDVFVPGFIVVASAGFVLLDCALVWDFIQYFFVSHGSPIFQAVRKNFPAMRRCCERKLERLLYRHPLLCNQ